MHRLLLSDIQVDLMAFMYIYADFSRHRARSKFPKMVQFGCYRPENLILTGGIRS